MAIAPNFSGYRNRVVMTPASSVRRRLSLLAPAGQGDEEPNRVIDSKKIVIGARGLLLNLRTFI